MDLPIACTLTEEQLRDRRREVIAPILSSVLKSEALEDGYAYTFQVSSDLLVRLARLVDLERQCCQFLSFRIIAAAGENTIRLGGPGAKEAIAEFFGS